MGVRSVFLLLPFALLTAVGVACTHTETKEVDDPAADDDDDDSTGDAGGPALADLQFRPATIYSGFDGTNSYKTPFAVYNADDDVEVKASPADAVTITKQALSNPDGDDGQYYFVDSKKAGDVTLTVTSKGRSATGTLKITAYTTKRYDAGKARYETDVDKAHPACSKCHGAGRVDHSPSALARVTDEKIGLIMSTGLSTGGFPIAVDKGTYPDGHKWTTGPGDEQDGLITYLRALPPSGFK
jgi:hypothetical protein